MSKINLLNNIKESEIYDYDTILEFVPYYYEIRRYLEEIILFQRDGIEIMSYVQENYKKSEKYLQLKHSLRTELEIQEKLMQSANFRYSLLKQTINMFKESAIECCNLVEYIVTFTVLGEEAKKNNERCIQSI